MSKTSVTTKQSGLHKLNGKRVLLMCANYFYEGKLEGIDELCVLLSDAGIVYLTGPWDENKWEDRQPLPKDHYVMLHAIESFGESSKSL